VRNSRVLGEWLATLLLVFSCGSVVEVLAVPTSGAGESSYTPHLFACEVRYYFREQFRDAEPGEKSVSAPSFERESLPTSRLLISKGLATRIVKGRVAHLPYQFLVKISRSRDSEVATLEVNVLDSSGEPVTGFPQVMPNPLTRAGDTSRKSFEIPVDEALKKKIEKTLLVQDQFLTHVDLVVGMDEDFLSADFPK
jgi:hypothetical protein